MSTNETIRGAQTYIRMLWRHRWVAVATATLMCIGGWTSVIMMPNQYESSAKVFVDTSSMLKPLLRGLAIDTGVREEMALMVRRTLLARPNLEAVARDSDLHLRAQTPQAFESVLRRLRKGIKVTGTHRDNIFDIRYQAENPLVATRVVQSLLNIYVEQSLGATRRDTTQTRKFLEQQIAEYEAKLRAAEERLKEFKQRHAGQMPAQGKDYYERLEGIREKLVSSRLELEEAINRRDELRRQLTGQRPNAGTEEQVAPSALEARTRELEANLDSLLLRYTESHPDVIATRRILEDLERQRREALARADGEGSIGEHATNPVYQELRVALGEAEADVAALEARVKEYERRKRELESRVDTIPEIEAQLARLNRDYEIHKRNYAELVGRREALDLSDDASQATNEIQFKIVESPHRPVLPVGPDRQKLSLAVFVLGAGGGGGLAWLLAMWNPAVYTRQELREFTGLPVLGTVSRVWTPRLRLARRLEVLSFGIACFGLLALLAVMLAVQPVESDLLQGLTKLREAL